MSRSPSTDQNDIRAIAVLLEKNFAILRTKTIAKIQTNKNSFWFLLRMPKVKAKRVYKQKIMLVSDLEIVFVFRISKNSDRYAPKFCNVGRYSSLCYPKLVEYYTKNYRKVYKSDAEGFSEFLNKPASRLAFQNRRNLCRERWKKLTLCTGRFLYGASKRNAGSAKQMVVFGTGAEAPSARPCGSKITASCPFCCKQRVRGEYKEFQKLKRFK